MASIFETSLSAQVLIAFLLPVPWGQAFNCVIKYDRNLYLNETFGADEITYQKECLPDHVIFDSRNMASLRQRQRKKVSVWQEGRGTRKEKQPAFYHPPHVCNTEISALGGPWQKCVCSRPWVWSLVQGVHCLAPSRGWWLSWWRFTLRAQWGYIADVAHGLWSCGGLHQCPSSFLPTHVPPTLVQPGESSWRWLAQRKM